MVATWQHCDVIIIAINYMKQPQQFRRPKQCQWQVATWQHYRWMRCYIGNIWNNHSSSGVQNTVSVTEVATWQHCRWMRCYIGNKLFETTTTVPASKIQCSSVTEVATWQYYRWMWCYIGNIWNNHDSSGVQNTVLVNDRGSDVTTLPFNAMLYRQ